MALLLKAKCVYMKEDAVHFSAWYKHSSKVVWLVAKRYIV